MQPPPVAARVEASGRIPDGVKLVPDYVGGDEQREILDWIRANASWPFDFDGTPCETLAGDRVPAWAQRIGAGLVEAGLLPVQPDYVHLVEYEPGAGLPAHVDHPTTGAVVCGVNLGSSRVLELTRVDGEDRVRMLLFPGDVYALGGEARDDWRHGVPATAVDTFAGRDYERGTAVSVTLRQFVAPAAGETPPG